MCAREALSGEDRRRLENQVKELEAELDTIKEDIRGSFSQSLPAAAIDKEIASAEEYLCHSVAHVGR
jgi:hypothetical protein